MSRTSRFAATLLALLALAALVAGCGRLPLTAPTDTVPAPDVLAAPDPPSRLGVGSTNLLNQILNPVTNLAWNLICSEFILKGTSASMSASHYSLQFAKGSLTESTTITMQEYDSKVLDVQFGPHGTKFDTPVILSIDFSGTACDPRIVTRDTPEPVLWYLNETTNTWEEVPGGTTDWANRKYIVPLHHFSRYVLGGKAGWKQGPPRADD